MSRNLCTGTLPMHAPHSRMTGIPLHRARGGAGAYVDFLSVSESERSLMERYRNAEFISRSAFHNASRRLEPTRQPVGTCFLPIRWNRGETSLLAFALEAEPAVAVFTGDGDTSSKIGSAPFRSATSLESALVALASRGGCPAIDLSSLRRGRRHQPHLPPLTRRIEKRPITHARSSVAIMRQGLCSRFLLCTAGARNHLFHCEIPSFSRAKRTYFTAVIGLCKSLPHQAHR